MCVPLILEDKLPLAESFVTGHHQLEKQLVTLLDSWCHPSFNVEDIRKYATWRNVWKPTVYVKASSSVCRLLNWYNCVHTFASAGSSLIFLCPVITQPISSPECSPNTFYDSWRNSRLTTVGDLHMSGCSCVLWVYFFGRIYSLLFIYPTAHRTVSQCFAQEETRLSSFPHV